MSKAVAIKSIGTFPSELTFCEPFAVNSKKDRYCIGKDRTMFGNRLTKEAVGISFCEQINRPKYVRKVPVFVVRALSTNDDDVSSPDADRRSALLMGLASIGMLTVSSTTEAAAPPPVKKETAEPEDYYSELLSAKKGKLPTLNLENYEKIKEGKTVSKPAGKSVSKPSGKPASQATKDKAPKGPAQPAAVKARPTKNVPKTGSSNATPSINPVEVILGLAAVASVGFLGSKSSSRASQKGTTIKKKPSKAPTRSMAGSRAGTVRLKPGTRKISAPKPTAAGTKIKTGTKISRAVPSPPKVASKTIKKAKAATSTKGEGKDSSIGSILGLGIAGIAIAGLLLSGSPSKQSIKPAKSPKNTVAMEKKTKKSDEAKKPKAVPTQPAPAPIISEVEKVVSEKIEAPPVKTSQEVMAQKPNSPPTSVATSSDKPQPVAGITPQNIAIAAAGALLVIAAASQSNSSENGGESVSSASQIDTSKSNEEKTAEERAAEAREWIEKWRSKQQ